MIIRRVFGLLNTWRLDIVPAKVQEPAFEPMMTPHGDLGNFPLVLFLFLIQKWRDASAPFS
jgi:hypothetical protein